MAALFYHAVTAKGHSCCLCLVKQSLWKGTGHAVFSHAFTAKGHSCCPYLLNQSLRKGTGDSCVWSCAHFKRALAVYTSVCHTITCGVSFCLTVTSRKRWLYTLLYSHTITSKRHWWCVLLFGSPFMKAVAVVASGNIHFRKAAMVVALGPVQFMKTVVVITFGPAVSPQRRCR